MADSGRKTATNDLTGIIFKRRRGGLVVKKKRDKE